MDKVFYIFALILIIVVFAVSNGPSPNILVATQEADGIKTTMEIKYDADDLPTYLTLELEFDEQENADKTYNSMESMFSSFLSGDNSVTIDKDNNKISTNDGAIIKQDGNKIITEGPTTSENIECPKEPRNEVAKTLKEEGWKVK